MRRKGRSNQEKVTYMTNRLPEEDRIMPRFAMKLVVHKTIDTLIADMVRVLGVDEQTARDTVADLIRNKDKLTVSA